MTAVELPTIHGPWIGRHEVREGPCFDVLDPSTGETLGRVRESTTADGELAVAAAHEAQLVWRATSARDRAEVLRRCFDLITERQEQIAQLISRENGKSIDDARGEVTYAAEFFRWYSEEAVRSNGHLQTSPTGGNRILVQYEPIGVAVLVTPWNFPAAMATRKIAPALAAGCGVVLKPAEDTPLTAFLIAEICQEAGVPAGLVNVVATTSPAQLVGSMLRNSRVRALSFTGSTAVGKLLLREAADSVLKCSMELGGNAPFIIFGDADLDAAIDGLMVAKMRNGGQACTAANRVFAHRSIAREVAERVAARMAALRIGQGIAESTQCGPLINQAAVEKVDFLVKEAVASGAEVLTGGRRLSASGNFYAPTVLYGVQDDAAIVRDEVFGPVASFMVFDHEDEVVASANGTEYGLSAYVYTEDLRRGLSVAGRLEVGMVAINRGMLSDAAAPFGGMKQSGLGREGGHDGIFEFMEAKYIATDW